MIKLEKLGFDLAELKGLVYSETGELNFDCGPVLTEKGTCRPIGADIACSFGRIKP